MSDEEVEAFHILPDRIPIWHGMERDDPETLGFSWTTSYKVAKWFADRMALLNNRPPFLASGFVKKEHVKTYMLDRGEFEIIAFPEDVEDILIEKI
jgi:hypothetical protein